jgi:NADH-quinone oxidoreductase subunit L
MHVEPVEVSFLWLIPVLPLLGVLFNASVGARVGRRLVGLVAPGVVGAAFGTTCYAWTQLLSGPENSALVDRVYPWIQIGTLQLDVAFTFDPLSAVMVSIITGVGFLIHIYSTGYMAEDADYARYFTYLNLFTFAMLLLVLADNLVLLFVGWEGVGLCSYLLIGFWYEKKENADAGKKAFIVNRVGDFGFLLGVFLLFWHLGGGAHDLSFREIASRVHEIPPATITIICLLLFVGATGKSAQLPLYVWLPDAMAGPTPVSALIHAATMVTAGIYMISRLSFLYILSPDALWVVACVGALTLVFAASIALVQTDIKKVLAYSTVSQLGYMFLALGVGAFDAAIFHLMTHAFFKALLFLGAGSVIHGMGGEQDIRKMGGLRHRMPVTFVTFFIGALAISGIPGLSGFFSKDEILFSAFNGSMVLWCLGAFGAGLTAFYMFRLVILTFFGECRATAEVQHHMHESPTSMTFPLMVLAGLSIVGGYVGLPNGFLWGHVLGHFLEPVLAVQHVELHSVSLEITLMFVSVAIALIGVAVAYTLYVARPGLPEDLAARFRAAHRLLLDKYNVDELYDAAFVRTTVSLSNWLWQVFDVRVVDGIVNGTASRVAGSSRSWRRLQTGDVQHYALSFLFGALLIVGYFALR